MKKLTGLLVRIHRSLAQRQFFVEKRVLRETVNQVKRNFPIAIYATADIVIMGPK